MKRPVLAILLAAGTLVALGRAALAGDQPSAPAQPAVGAEQPADLLGAVFESESAGISLRIPLGCQRIASTNAGDDIAQFGDPKRKWELKITRVLRDTPTSLAGGVDNFGKPVPGLLDVTAVNLKRDLSGSTILRKDLTNIADAGLGDKNPTNNVGMIALRYSAGGGHFLSQQAIIQATERLFYLISLTNPAPDSVGPGIEPSDSERTAVHSFKQMLDSVRLLDTAAIRREQDDRLVRTRALLLALKNRERLHAVLVSEQWLRVLRNGRDIGYSYITEQTAAGVPRPLKPQELADGKGDRDLVKPGDGVLIGVRSRSISPPDVVVDGALGPAAAKPRGPVQVDNATWLYVSPDQGLEDWSRIIVVDDGSVDKDGKRAQRQLTEFGSSTIQVKSELDMALPQGVKGDIKQPPVVQREHHKLDVTTITDSGASEPLSQELPVFYLPQATGHLLPRLLPLVQRSFGEARTYMFATYVPDTRQVMTRYVDVGSEGEFNLAGQSIRAIPIADRIGWRGSVTTHYVGRDGKYLGSENKDTHTVILPTDAATLQGIWRGANLSQPGGVQRPGRAEAGPSARPATPISPGTPISPVQQGR